MKVQVQPLDRKETGRVPAAATREGSRQSKLAMGESPPGQGAARRGIMVLFCALFIVLLWMPVLDSVFHLDKSPTPIENRSPAKFPAWGSGIAGLRGYIAGLEAYFNDHFGFRKLFIRTHGFLAREGFRQGSTQVLIGRGQWLFYAGNRMVDCHLGLQLLSAKQLSDWRQLLEKRRQWLAQRGIKYLFIVAPNKESIYPEHLPDWADKPGAATLLDQFLAFMKTNSIVEILDLRPALLEAKASRRAYLITDTHWNYFGAFAAYREIVRTLSKQLPEMEPPMALDAFELRYSQRPGGDLARMIAQEHSMPEEEFVSLVPRPPLLPLEVKTDPAILPKQWAPGEAPHSTEQPAKRYKAVLFHDSFAEFLMPFLGYQFKRVVFIWQRPWDLAVIEKEKPDVVIDEILERSLDWPLASQ